MRSGGSNLPDTTSVTLFGYGPRYGGKREKITREKRGKCLANLARVDLTEAGKRHLLVCSDHFLSFKYMFVSY